MMKRALPRMMLPILVGLLLPGFVDAGPPDAGTLLQEQRQPRPTLPDRIPLEEEKEIEKPPSIDKGPRVLVKAFRFTGHEGISTEAELQNLVQGGIGKELSISDLQELAGLITGYLRGKGYLLARAYLPKQDVTEGTIEIAIVSGRIDGRPRINIEESSRLNPALLQDIADRAIPEGDAVRLERIERAVLLMNDLPGINARASLEPGETPGSTRIVVNVDEGPLFQGLLSSDNFGDRYTGTYRGTGHLSATDPFGLGDQVNLSLTGADNLYQWRAAYALPLWSTGWTWSAAYTGLSYELGKEFSDLDAKGWADTVFTGVSYPVIRSRNATVRTGLGFEYLMLSDEAVGVTISDRKLSVGSASVTGNFFDTFNGGGLTNGSIILTGGSVDLDLASERAGDDAGPQTAGGFTRGTYSIARLQRLTPLISLLGAARGQIASTNLDSSQKFILGGPAGVRAYPVGEAPGDEGHIFTIEARLDLPFLPAWASTQLIGFYDAGWIKLHKHTWPGSITNASGKNEYWLQGAGAGISVGKSDLYSLRVYYAHKIRTNDGRSATGMNADNLSDDGRFWLQLVVWL